MNNSKSRIGESFQNYCALIMMMFGVTPNEFAKNPVRLGRAGAGAAVDQRDMLANGHLIKLIYT